MMMNPPTGPPNLNNNDDGDGDGGCYFPDEVIVQILARLPIKSLFRAKSVCKLWYTLSSDRYFIHLYNHHLSLLRNPTVLLELSDFSGSSSSNSSPPTFICVDRFRGVLDFPLDFINDRLKIRASCNGLLCCSSIPDKGVYYVCNPITRQYKLLPRTRERPITRFYPNGDATLVGLACNLSTPHKFSVVLAGYHRSFGHRPDNAFTCFIFDSDSNKWRKFVSFLDDHFTHMNRNQVVFVNGSLHWLTKTTSCVLVLDLSVDTWRKIPLPKEVIDGTGDRVYLLESDGYLSLIQISEDWMILWVLKDYYKEEWEIVDRVSLRCIKQMVPGVFPISQNGEYVFLATYKQVMVYSRKSRSWKEMYSVKNGCTLPLWFSAHAFRSTIFTCR